MKGKKLLALLLVTVLLVGIFAGCSKGSTEQEGKEGSDTASPVSSDEETVITFMCSGVKSTVGEDFRLETLPRLVKEKYPNVTVETVLLPDDQYYTALKTKLATGEAPDIMWVQPRWGGANASYTLAEAGYLADLSDLKAVSLVGDAVDSFTYEGKVIGLPAGITFLGTYYNADIFEEHNLSVPTNWDEFLEVCETLQKAGVQPVVMGDKDMYVMQFGLYQLAANMVYPNDPTYDDKLRDGSAKFTDDGVWNAVIARYAELYEKEYIPEGSLGLGIAQAQQKFNDGEAAMIFDGTFNTQALVASDDSSFTRGYFPLPGNNAGEQLYAAGAPGAGPAIYADTQNLEICKDILELWFDGESDLYKAYETNGKFNSTNEGAYVNPLYQDFMDLYAEGNSWYWCNQAWPPGTEVEMEVLFGELIGGVGTTPEQVAEGMQRKFDELLGS